MATTMVEFPVADYAAMSREQLRELVGGFDRDAFAFCLHVALEELPPLPVTRNSSPEAVAALLESAVDGFVALGPDALGSLLEVLATYRKQAAWTNWLRKNAESARWIRRADALTGGARRTVRLLDLAAELIHERKKRDGAGRCGSACCDPLWWTKQGHPEIDRARAAKHAAVQAPRLVLAEVA